MRALLAKSGEIETAFAAARGHAAAELLFWRLLVILALCENGGEGNFPRPKNWYQQAFAALERRLNESDEAARLRRPGVSLGDKDRMDVAFDEIEIVMKALPQPTRESVDARP